MKDEKISFGSASYSTFLEDNTGFGIDVTILVSEGSK